MIPSNKILALIKATVDYFEHDFMSGDCGTFAIALATLLWEQRQGMPEFLVEYGSHYEGFDHVAVLYGGVAYDGSGVYKRKTGKHLKGYDEWNRQDYDIEYTEFPFSDEDVAAIERYTSPDGVFAHGTSLDETLGFMRKWWAANAVVESLLI